MCTSFVSYKNKTLYAMNFDFMKVDLGIRIDDSDTFIFEIKAGEQFLETACMNTNGFFGNFQGNLSAKHINIIPDSKCITIDKLYRKAIKSCKSIDDFEKILDNKTVAYAPVPPDYNKNHNMFADKNGKALVLETSNGKNDITYIENNFLVMTNFPLGDYRKKDYRNVSGVGADRYIKAYEYLLSHEKIDEASAFEILKNTAQKEDEFETLVSMVFLPEEFTIYMSLLREYDKIIKINMKEKTAETFKGYENHMSIKIHNSGTDLKTLFN